MTKFSRIFFSRNMFLMLLTGFSSGLPLALTAGTLQAWMKTLDVDLKTIGIFSIVGLPYTIKFFWAPVLDRFVPPFLGRRRGWMLITQICLVFSIAALSFTNPREQSVLVAFLCVLIAFFSASQDIVIDAFRTDTLTGDERGAGASISNLGYRLAMLISGNVALIMADHMSWEQVYLTMAGLTVVGLIATFIAQEPVAETKPPATLLEAYREPLVEYFERGKAYEILLFIVLYKIDIVLAVALMTPFMIDIGFSLTEIGVVAKTVGMVCSIIGSLVGGALYAKWGMKKSLLLYGIIQGCSTLSFAALAAVGKNSLALALTVGFENFCAGLATVPFIAFLMALCDRRFTAAQYALLSSFAALSRVFAGRPAAELVERLGWMPYFFFCALTAIPGLAFLVLRFEKWLPNEGRPASETSPAV